MELPYFKLYIMDFIHGTRRMSAAQKGGYINLLIEQWDQGYLKNDDDYLRETSQINGKNLAKVLEKFQLGPDGLYRNDRLEQERKKAQKTSSTNKDNGSKGGKRKAENLATATNPQSETIAKDEPKPSILELESEVQLENTIITHLGKTQVGNEFYEGTAADYLRARKQPMIETTIMQYPDLRMEDVLAAVDKKYPVGFHFKDHNHPFNCFRSVCEVMMREKSQGFSNDKKEKYVKPRSGRSGSGMQGIRDKAREILSGDPGSQ
jgi:uncharacterized protein YdaU (DUF1376 family)